MEMLSSRSNACNIRRQIGLLFILLAISHWSVAKGQEPVIFLYKKVNLWGDNFEAHYSAPDCYHVNDTGSYVISILVVPFLCQDVASVIGGNNTEQEAARCCEAQSILANNCQASGHNLTVEMDPTKDFSDNLLGMDLTNDGKVFSRKFTVEMDLTNNGKAFSRKSTVEMDLTNNGKASGHNFAVYFEMDTEVYTPPKLMGWPRQKHITIIVAAAVPSVIVFLLLGSVIISTLYRCGPKKFRYKELARATKDFNSKEKVGEGGFGSVYKGSLVLEKGESSTEVCGFPLFKKSWIVCRLKAKTEIAVKRISATSKQGEREFLAEVKILGQAQHRNLVRLLGWCHEKGELLLVYDYMPNGSVYDQLYKNAGSRSPVFTWDRRLKITFGVASALTYLHEEWEHRVIHRDVKSSNVMLDLDFNARLGDFGLARLYTHDQSIPATEAMAGTYGYIAPELHKSFTPTEKTDVYSFGAMMLEIATGKRPVLLKEDRESLNRALLVDWVWDLYRDNALLEAADPTLQNAYDPGEMAMFLKIGLLCCHFNPDERPGIREVINIWKGSSPIPILPRSRPVPVLPVITGLGLGAIEDAESDMLIQVTSENCGYVSASQTFIVEANGHTSLTFTSEGEGYTLPQEKEEGRNTSPDSTFIYRQTPSSLPF